ncbi:hypothetical protein N7528_004860 [Penicillium herquei]|nr:hypothetical protein N7528_004860 [Penicillium herquei]
MYFTTLLTSTLALAMSISAAPTPVPATPENTRYVQLRLYSDADCGQDGNLGELGVYGDYVNKCNAFGDYTVESVRFEAAINNCIGQSCIPSSILHPAHPGSFIILRVG